jgi:hypothetical protein
VKLKLFFIAAIFCIAINAQANEKESKEKKSQLITPTLWAVSPDHFACNLTNVSKKNRIAQVRIITNGDILLDSGEVTVQPMHTVDHFIDGLPDGGPIYCEFTVEGRKNWYRGAAKLFRDSPNTTDFLVISAE